MPGPSTKAVHGGEVPDPRTGAVNTPVFLSSTFWYPELPGGGKSEYMYSRYTNPSVDAVEAKLAQLEGAEGSLLFGSGMGAIMTACMALLEPGDTVAVQQGIYGGTTAFLRDELARYGVRVHPLPEVATPKVPEGTALVWMESVTNPLLRVAHVPEWAAAAHKVGAKLCVDATFASPILQRPIELGADLVMHSATKYLGGHSDLIAGALSWRKKSGLRDDLWRVRRNWGPTLDPHAAYLLGRGMKTLAIRMRKHCENARALAEAAAEMPSVRAVHYPGMSDHADRATVARVLPDGCGGMLTLDLGTLKAAQRFRRKVKLIAPAASLGGVESLVSLPIETSHAYATADERERLGIGDGLVRISVGIEDIEDLIVDVRRAAA